MRNKQQGVTLIGWIVLLVPVAIVFYAGIRLAPAYLNYMKVARSVEQVAAEYKGEEQVTLQQLRNSLEKRFDVESVDYPAVKDIDFHREGTRWVAQAKYEDIVPFVSQISLLVKFDKRVELH
jgi:hypothetical protein